MDTQSTQPGRTEQKMHALDRSHEAALARETNSQQHNKLTIPHSKSKRFWNRPIPMASIASENVAGIGFSTEKWEWEAPSAGDRRWRSMFTFAAWHDAPVLQA